ncbi:DnaA ATPase domain-containing protein [Jhaorihella thermophila]
MDQNKQIIISADRAPGEIKDLEERVKSRLQCGLVVDLHPTDYELRLGILQSKVQQYRATYPDLEISDGVLEFLAHRISTNVRVLEGALTRLFLPSHRWWGARSTWISPRTVWPTFCARRIGRSRSRKSRGRLPNTTTSGFPTSSAPSGCGPMRGRVRWPCICASN